MLSVDDVNHACEWLGESQSNSDEFIALPPDSIVSQTMMQEARLLIDADILDSISSLTRTRPAVIAGSFTALLLRRTVCSVFKGMDRWVGDMVPQRLAGQTLDGMKQHLNNHDDFWGSDVFGDIDIWCKSDVSEACEWNAQYPFGHVESNVVVNGTKLQVLAFCPTSLDPLNHSSVFETETDQGLAQHVLSRFDIQPPKVSLDIHTRAVTMTKGALWCAIHRRMHVPMGLKHLVEHRLVSCPLECEYEKPGVCKSLDLPELKVCYSIPTESMIMKIPIHLFKKKLPTDLIRRMSTENHARMHRARVPFESYLKVALAQEKERGNQHCAILSWWFKLNGTGKRLYHDGVPTHRESWLVDVLNSVMRRNPYLYDYAETTDACDGEPPVPFPRIRMFTLQKVIRQWRAFSDTCVNDEAYPEPPAWRTDVSNSLIGWGATSKKHNVSIDNIVSAKQRVSCRLIERLQKYQHYGYRWEYSRLVDVTGSTFRSNHQGINLNQCITNVRTSGTPVSALLASQPM